MSSLEHSLHLEHSCKTNAVVHLTLHWQAHNQPLPSHQLILTLPAFLPFAGVLAASKQPEQYRKCMQGISTVSLGRSKRSNHNCSLFPHTGDRCTTNCPLHGTLHTGHFSGAPPPPLPPLPALLPLTGVLAASRQPEQYRKCMHGISTGSFS